MLVGTLSTSLVIISVSLFSRDLCISINAGKSFICSKVTFTYCCVGVGTFCPERRGRGLFRFGKRETTE